MIMIKNTKARKLKDNALIPVVIVHKGYQDYLEVNLKITGRHNKVYLIGDSSLSKLGAIKNVEFVDISKYENNPEIKKLKKHFVNYATNNAGLVWLWFMRVFIIHLFLKEFSIKRIFHLDSDCLLLKDINTFAFEKQIAYVINQNYSNKYRMSNSIHCSLINREFCEAFEKLFADIYVSGKKFGLIKGKIEHHAKSNVPGGVCDMTLYYLLQNQKLIDVDNLSRIREIDGKLVAFINRINDGEGPDSKTQYLIDNKLKILRIFKGKGGANLVFDTISKKYVEIYNIHFQGNAKGLMRLKYFDSSGFNFEKARRAAILKRISGHIKKRFGIPSRLHAKLEHFFGACLAKLEHFFGACLAKKR